MAFLTKIMLATDGPEDVALAVQAAVDPNLKTGAESHIAHVWHMPAGA